MMPRSAFLCLFIFLLASSASAQRWTLESSLGSLRSEIEVPEVLVANSAATRPTLALFRTLLGNRFSIGLLADYFQMPVLSRRAGIEWRQSQDSSPRICGFTTLPCSYLGEGPLFPERYLDRHEFFVSTRAGIRYTLPVQNRLAMRATLAGGAVWGSDLTYRLTSEDLGGNPDFPVVVYETAVIDNRLSPTWSGALDLSYRLSPRFSLGVRGSYREVRLYTTRDHTLEIAQSQPILRIQDPLPLRQYEVAVFLGYHW